MVLSPSSQRKTAQRGSGMAGFVDATAARTLAPPEIAPLSSEEEFEFGEEEEDMERAVDVLLLEIEVLKNARAFPRLEELSAIDQKRDVYLGPTMESNWVLPGRLLVGAYPASMNDSHHAHLLCTILLQGISTFVCLQQEYRAEGVTEKMWRSGEALRPYFQDVLQLLRKLQELKAADPRAVPTISKPHETDFVHFPIVDCNIADDTKVLELAAKLAGRIARGEVMYLHCWGGHGRTGTVVSIMLHLMYGLGADEAMARCQHVHDVRRIPISVGSPQTDAQRQQVRRVIGYVSRARRLSCPPATRAVASSTAATQNAVVAAPVVVVSSKRSKNEAPAAPTVSKPSERDLLSPNNPSPSSPTRSSPCSEIPNSTTGKDTDTDSSIRGSREKERKSGVVVFKSSPSPVARRTAVSPPPRERVRNKDRVGVAGRRASPASPGGGRRGWIRGRRQAFAQAPIGVDEDASGWVPTDGSSADSIEHQEEEEQQPDLRCKGTASGGIDGKKARSIFSGAPSSLPRACESDDGGSGDGRRLRTRTILSTAVYSSGSGGGGDGEGSTAVGETSSEARVIGGGAPPRRKSINEPYDTEDTPTRGTKTRRLRRKSTPGNTPAPPSSPSTDPSSSVSGVEDDKTLRGAAMMPSAACSGSSNGGGGALSQQVGPALAGRRPGMAMNGGVVDVQPLSPESCTSAERCSTRSTSVEGVAAGGGHHVSSPCGVSGRAR